MKEFLLTIVFLFSLTVGYSQTAKRGVEKQHPSSIQLFPNPTTTYFRVKGSNQIDAIYLYNLIGKRVKTFYPKKIDDFYINDLSNGLYLVQMIDGNGEIVATSRLTKR